MKKREREQEKQIFIFYLSHSGFIAVKHLADCCYSGDRHSTDLSLRSIRSLHPLKQQSCATVNTKSNRMTLVVVSLCVKTAP